ncbi:MAG: Maf-like protein [Bacteroides sp.]|nr:Maf-like protein [Bacteroides sp.]
MFENLKNYKIILASNSPRRKELLAGLGIEYIVQTLPDIDESFPEGLPPEEIPLYIARKKAAAYRNQMQEDELIITADTIVWLDGEVLGKPTGKEDAVAMLEKLSDKKHQVITGVCLTTTHTQRTFATVTDVEFDTLSQEEILYYVEQYLPLDKAGAYGIQEWIGIIGVRSISGSYFNVMGLPIQKLYKELIAL